MRKLTHLATEEELLQEVIDELKDAIEDDIASGIGSSRDQDFKYKYPLFLKKVKEKAEQFKQNGSGYRAICCLPAFALGLVFASRIRSHYTHSPWFKLGRLSKMIDVYGTVSK